ncbi:MAG: YigZ family protein [Clostridia bacterium]|nr:YigZ family protein [Clostridia bacterium]
MAEEKVYITVKGYGEARFEEKKSVFIGYCEHVTSEEEALDFVKKIKEKHRDATHNCYGYVMKGGILCRYSDDGEPQGTAGKPILDMLVKSGVDDVCVVVTRYFGGTLLGTGGLVHAYSQGAKMAVEAAGVAQFENYVVLQVACSYSDYQKIGLELERCDAIIDNTDYSDVVSVQFAVKERFTDEITRKISEITSGKNVPAKVCERFDAK